MDKEPNTKGEEFQDRAYSLVNIATVWPGYKSTTLHWREWLMPVKLIHFTLLPSNYCTLANSPSPLKWWNSIIFNSTLNLI